MPLFPHQKSSATKPLIRFYGRRLLRPVGQVLAGKQAQLDEAFGLTPHNVVHWPLVPNVPEHWLEIGFGGGEHLVGLAQAHPHVGLIGAEAFLNGVAQAYGHMLAVGVQNVRIWPDDVRLLLPFLPNGCLQRIYLLFPDPWPKKRHVKRRMLQQNVLAQFARVLAKGGQLNVATDHADLGLWMQEQLDLSPHFSIVRQASTPPDFWVTTRYQQKALDAGRDAVFISAVHSGL